MITYKLGVNGAIDDSQSFKRAEYAKQRAKDLAESTPAGTYAVVWVYGEDNSPNAATPFWRHYGVDSNGSISQDGTMSFHIPQDMEYRTYL